MANKEAPRVLSLFTGVGGLDYGFEAAGFRIAAALEKNSAACKCLESNRTWRVLQGDINSIESSAILQQAEFGVGDADVLIGGPPCQPFSPASYGVNGDAKRLDDPRATTLSAFLRVLRDTKPRAFLLENVAGIAFRKKDEGLQLLLQGVEEINRALGTQYSVKWKILNAADFGVPQQRERVFLVGARDGTEFEFPAPTHSNDLSEIATGKKEPYRTAWDAIGDLDSLDHSGVLNLRGAWANLLPSIPEGRNYLWHTEKGGGLPLFGWRTKYWSFLLKLKKSLPAWTIQAHPGPATGPFHWRNRRLSITELGRLQTFPDGLKIDGGILATQRLIGNAVPSLMAEILAREIKKQILRVRVGSAPKLLLEHRDPPRATPVRAVPRQFYHLIGIHKEHPGTGKGPRALRGGRVIPRASLRKLVAIAEKS